MPYERRGTRTFLSIRKVLDLDRRRLYNLNRYMKWKTPLSVGRYRVRGRGLMDRVLREALFAGSRRVGKRHAGKTRRSGHRVHVDAL